MPKRLNCLRLIILIKKRKKVDDGVDYLINKVQGELEQNNKHEINNNPNINQYKNEYQPQHEMNMNQYESPKNEMNAQREPIAQ